MAPAVASAFWLANRLAEAAGSHATDRRAAWAVVPNAVRDLTRWQRPIHAITAHETQMSGGDKALRGRLAARL